MVRRVAYLAAFVGLAFALAGCGFSFFGYERRAAWHDQEERACSIRREVQVSAYVQPARAINDRGACGIDRPLKVSAMEDGTVSIGPSATINCPMTAMVERWLGEAVQPAALAWFGMPVIEIKQIASYACRTRNSEPGESLSEHAYGNALDVAGFRLANGRMVLVKTDWGGGGMDAQGFLREVFTAACDRFKTVLGPGVRYHGDHFHLDLAHHNAGGTSRYCSPRPASAAPRRAPYSGVMARGGGLLDWNRTGSIAPASPPGELLENPPADVIANELSDPFGAFAMNPSVSGN